MKLSASVLREVSVFLAIGLAIAAMMILVGCSGSGGPSVQGLHSPSMTRVGGQGADSAVMESSTQRDSRILNKQRPGLGTGWGDEISSSLGRTSFLRQSNRPFGGVAMIYYNDREGIEAMAGSWKNRSSAYQKAANGTVEWGVKGSLGSAAHYLSGRKRYVVGKKNRSYSLVVRNVSDSRLEIVLSVDGLDVMDGKAASFKKRGYIVGAGETIEVKGFRTSYDAVAAFKFASVNASYSNLRHGTTRDVGVIGLAVFTEKGHDPWRWSRRELNQRREAQPFAEAPLKIAR